jgi:hypothetical protein
VQQKTLGKFPFFYFYVACLLLADGSLYALSLSRPAAYPVWNWNAGFLNIIVGSGILLEVFQHVLAPYPGAEKLARICGLAVFGVLLSLGAGYLIFAPRPSQTMARNLEKNLLAVQAMFLVILVGVIFYYGIAMGRNIQGIMTGYGLCVATTLMTLAVRSYAGSSFDAAWILIQPIAYWICLFVWMTALWKYEPNPSPLHAADAARDYEAFVSGTQATVGEMRSNLGRAARP